jgi:hypothetical protein
MTTATPSAREVFDKLAAEHLQQPGTGRRPMFGRDCLTVDGHNVAFFHDAHLALRLPPTAADVLLDSGAAVAAHMGTRVMRNWVAVPFRPDGAHRWGELLGQATTYATSNPDRRPGARRTAPGS